MKLKKLLSLLASMAMTVAAVTGAISVSASEVANGTCGEGITWTLDSEGKLTISGKGEMASPKVTDLSVENGFATTGPTALAEELKTQLKDYADIYTYKEHTEDIKEVVIDEGITSIGFAAFYKMPNLETVILPSTISEFKGIGYSTQNEHDGHGHGSLTAYASMAFVECTKLKSLTLTEGMTAIGSIAFYGCTALESVRIPSTILYEHTSSGGVSLESNYGWGPYSFIGCTSLKNISLPEGLTVIGACAFENAAVESVVIPSTIENWDYANTTAYGGTLPENYNAAFANCKKLSSVTFTEGLQKIGKVPFSGCPKLTNIAVPKSITNMERAFAYCNGLQEAYIEDGAVIGTYVGGTGKPASDGFDYAFYNCTNLKKLELPEGVEIIYNYPQWCTGCTSLTDIYLHGKEYMSARVNALNEISKFHCYPETKLYNNLSDKRKANLEEDLSNAKDTLNTKLKEANAVNESDYTAESYAALKTAIENAEKFDESYTGVLPIEWAAEDISNAINSLVKKPAQAVKPGTAKPSITTPNVKSQAQKNAENAMKQAKITKLTVKSKAKKKITVTWKKVSKANGYQVQVSTNKKFKKSKIVLTKTTSKKKITIKKLKSKKTYFVRVRAYATYKDSNGKPQKVYSSWIKKTRKVKVK